MTVVQEDQGAKLLRGTQLQKRKQGHWFVASGSGVAVFGRDA